MRSSRSDTALPPELADAVDRARDRLGPFAGRIRYFAEIGSTNDVAASLAPEPESFGTVVIADAQTAGRSRRGRAWFSPAASGLYVSVIVAPSRGWTHSGKPNVDGRPVVMSNQPRPPSCERQTPWWFCW